LKWDFIPFGFNMGHLKENNITYWKHWAFAMKLSLALFIHGWFPNILTDYASKEMEKSKGKKDINITDYF
jgi:hypothetical protein